MYATDHQDLQKLMSAWTRHKGGKSGDEIQGFEQYMGGAVSARVFEFMDHQAIAIDTQPFQGDWPPRHD